MLETVFQSSFLYSKLTHTVLVFLNHFTEWKYSWPNTSLCTCTYIQIQQYHSCFLYPVGIFQLVNISIIALYLSGVIIWDRLLYYISRLYVTHFRTNFPQSNVMTLQCLVCHVGAMSTRSGTCVPTLLQFGCLQSWCSMGKSILVSLG